MDLGSQVLRIHSVKDSGNVLIHGTPINFFNIWDRGTYPVLSHQKVPVKVKSQVIGIKAQVEVSLFDDVESKIIKLRLESNWSLSHMSRVHTA